MSLTVRLTKRCTLFYLLFLIGGASSVLAQTKEPLIFPGVQSVGVVFTYDRLLNPYVIVNLRINGSEPLPFLLDTGTSFPLMIDAPTAKKLHLQPNGQKYRVNRSDVTGDIASVDKVELVGSLPGDAGNVVMPLDLKNINIYETTLPEGTFPDPRPVGIIGIALLDTVPLQFDFAAKTLTVYRPDYTPPPAKNALVLPLKRTDSGLYTVSLRPQEGDPLDFMLDTGAELVSIPQADVKRFRPAQTPPVIKNWWGINGLTSETMFLLPDPQLGNWQEPNVAVASSVRGYPGAILGIDFLSRFRVTLDVPHLRLILERSADYTKRLALSGLSCVSLASQKGQFAVIDVLPASNAANAGVRVGDKIVTVNGRSLGDLSFVAAQNWLDGLADTQAELTLEGAEKARRQVHYQRQSLFTIANGRGIGVGIGIVVTKEGKILIEATDLRSPASEAGLQGGDEIVTENGLPVKTTPFPQIAAQMKQPEGAEITLTI